MFEKQNSKKRSPLKTDPMRQPGQSLQEKILDIFYDKLVWPAMIIFLLLALVIFEWMRKLFPAPPHPVFLTLLFLIVCTFFVIKNVKYIKEIKNLKLGRDGEKFIGNFLEGLREKGYKVYHDIVGECFNIDHILVGPGGVYTIETKTISKSKKGNPQILYDGINLKIDGFVPDRDPIMQAKSQKYWLENFIERNAKVKITVRPVILYPGWYINQEVGHPEIWVLNEKALPAYLDKEGTVLSPEQINLIASHIEIFNR